MGRCNHARAGLDGVVPAHPVKMPIAEHAKQAGLQVKRHVADFIEKQRAALGLFKAATAHGLRTGKRATFVTKQLAFQQLLGNGCGIDGNKRAVGTA